MTYTIRTDGSESTGPEGIYLVWGGDYWDGIKVEERECLDDALRCYHAWDYSDHGNPTCIEGPAGVVPEREVEAWVKAAYAREREATTKHRDNLVGQTRYAVMLRAPDSNEAVEFDTTDDLSDAVELLGRLNKPGRTRIVLLVFDGRGWRTERVIHDWGTANEQQEAA